MTGSPPINVEGTLQPDGSPVIVGGTITRDIHSFSGLPFSTAYLIGTQTLAAAAPAIAILGTLDSLQPGGSSVVVGTSTRNLGDFLVSSALKVLVGSQTIVAGAPAITISGILYSLYPGGSSVVIGGTTTRAVNEILDSSSAVKYQFGSQTLIAGGPAITVSGTLVSLEAGGSSVVIGGTIENVEILSTKYGNGAESTILGVGGIIVSLGGFAAPTDLPIDVGGSGYNGTVFTGCGVEQARDISLSAIIVCGSIAVIALL